MEGLGSQISSSEKEKSSRQNFQQQKIQTIVKEEAQSPVYNIPFDGWRILHANKQILLSSLDLDTRSSLATISLQMSPQTEKGAGMTEEKKVEASSLINYLPGTLKSSIHSILVALLGIFKVSDINYADKLYTKELLQNKKINTRQLMKINRNKQIVCFSSKWRINHTTIYIIFHKYSIKQPTDMHSSAFLINQNGLILQAITNIRYKIFWDQISSLIKKHYRKLQNLIIVAEKGQIVILEDFEKIHKNFQNIQVAMVNTRNSKSWSPFGKEQYFRLYSNDLIEGTYVSLVTNKQVVVWFNSIPTENLTHRIGLVSTIMALEESVASLFSSINFYSKDFWYMQIVVRIYAFYFNFVTLNSMQASSKEELVRVVAEKQLAAMRMREQDHANKSEKLKAHTYSTHPSPLHCPVCKKRTKIKCEKCCFDLNRHFGICQKECFGVFHSDIASYRPIVLKSKQIVDYNRQEQSEQSDEELASLSKMSLNGRKKIKMNQDSMSSDSESESSSSSEGIEIKRIRMLEEAEAEKAKFRMNCALGLLPPLILKKFEHMEKIIKQLRAKHRQNSQALIKEEQHE